MNPESEGAAMRILFWVSVVVLVWPWLGYPAAIWILARLRPRQIRRSFHCGRQPVTVAVVARDEAAHLGRKLESIAASGLPPELIETIVVDDGSVDATATVARELGARVISLPKSIGKAAALNVARGAASHPLLVLTDARQPFMPGALAALLAPFSDPRVAAVGGELAGAATGAGGVYRRFDDLLRRLESASGSTVGVAGAIWAVRRSLLPSFPDELVLDDVFGPLVVARTGRRVVIEPEAKVAESPLAASEQAERHRRVRTLAGNVQLLVRAPWLLCPCVNPLWWRFVSHKVLRIFGPAGCVGIAVSLPVLAVQESFFRLVGLAFVAGLALAVTGRRAAWLGTLARAFVCSQWLCAVAWWYAVSGRSFSLWRMRES
ncbi:MAG: glycosyltransferase [Pseudomonadota bacterium]